MSHKLGQVFLKDQNILKKLMMFSDVKPTDHVVEIGCGEGVLSVRLADKVKRLTIIEIDKKWVEYVQGLLTDQLNVEILHQDVLTVDFNDFGDPIKVVANIPYYISAKIIKLFIRYRDSVDDVTLMVQKEFAGKCLAKPGDSLYTSLSVLTQFYYDVEAGFDVSKHCFRPVPKVDSAVIRLTPKSTLLDVEEGVFFNMVRSGFWGRRKPFVSALKKSPYLSLDLGFESVSFFITKGKVRAEMLSVDDFYTLYLELKQYVKSTC